RRRPDEDVEGGGRAAALGGHRGDGVTHVLRVTGGDGHHRDVVVDYLLGERAQLLPARAESGDRHPLLRDDVERLAADRPGGTQQREGGHSTASSTSTARSR